MKNELKDEGGRMLLIVDPQIDFITGSLPVPGAEEAMERLADYVKRSGDDYDMIAITADRHPMGHSSFKEAGGRWPVHCVECSVGAALWPSVLEALYLFSDHVVILYKGQDRERDEYSILDSEEGRRILEEHIKGGCNERDSREITAVDICGLAGDVCVAKTLEDLKSLYPKLEVRVLKRFTASLDGGERLRDLTRIYGLDVME